MLTEAWELAVDVGAATSEACCRVPPSSRIFIDWRTPNTFLANCWHTNVKNAIILYAVQRCILQSWSGIMPSVASIWLILRLTWHRIYVILMKFFLVLSALYWATKSNTIEANMQPYQNIPQHKMNTKELVFYLWPVNKADLYSKKVNG